MSKVVNKNHKNFLEKVSEKNTKYMEFKKKIKDIKSFDPALQSELDELKINISENLRKSIRKILKIKIKFTDHTNGNEFEKKCNECEELEEEFMEKCVFFNNLILSSENKIKKYVLKKFTLNVEIEDSISTFKLLMNTLNPDDIYEFSNYKINEDGELEIIKGKGLEISFSQDPEEYEKYILKYPNKSHFLGFNYVGNFAKILYICDSKHVTKYSLIDGLTIIKPFKKNVIQDYKKYMSVK